MRQWLLLAWVLGLVAQGLSAFAQSPLIEWQMEFADGTTGAVAGSFEQYNVRATTKVSTISSTLDAAQLNLRWTGSGFNPNGLIVSDPDENGPTRAGSKSRCAFGWDLTYNTAMQTPPATLTGRTDTAWAVFTFGAGISGSITDVTIDTAHIRAQAPNTLRFFLTWDDAGVKKTAYTSAIALGTPLSVDANTAYTLTSSSYTKRTGSFAAGSYSGSTLPTGTALAGKSFLLEVYAYGGTRSLEDDAQTADYNQRGYLHLDNLIVNGIVGSCSTITLTPVLPANGTVGTAYSQTFSASGGTAPYTYSLTTGTLPAGLSLNSATGAVSGTPTTSNGAGASIAITATDTYGCTGVRNTTLKVCPVISIATPTGTGTCSNWRPRPAPAWSRPAAPNTARSPPGGAAPNATTWSWTTWPAPRPTSRLPHRSRGTRC